MEDDYSDYDQDAALCDSLEAAQIEFTSATVHYDAIKKNQDYYTFDYIEQAVNRLFLAENAVDIYLAEFYYSNPDKLNALLKRKNVDLSTLESFKEYYEGHYENPDCYSQLGFSSYMTFIYNSI